MSILIVEEEQKVFRRSPILLRRLSENADQTDAYKWMNTWQLRVALVYCHEGKLVLYTNTEKYEHRECILHRDVKPANGAFDLHIQITFEVRRSEVVL